MTSRLASPAIVASGPTQSVVWRLLLSMVDAMAVVEASFVGLERAASGDRLDSPVGVASRPEQPIVWRLLLPFDAISLWMWL